MNATAEKLEAKMKNNIDTRVALLEQSITNINETLKRFEKRFDTIDDKLSKIDFSTKEEFKNIRSEINEIRRDGWSQMRWIIGFMIAFMSSPLISQLIKLIHNP